MGPGGVEEGAMGCADGTTREARHGLEPGTPETPLVVSPDVQGQVLPQKPSPCARLEPPAPAQGSFNFHPRPRKSRGELRCLLLHRVFLVLPEPRARVGTLTSTVDSIPKRFQEEIPGISSKGTGTGGGGGGRTGKCDARRIMELAVVVGRGPVLTQVGLAEVLGLGLMPGFGLGLGLSWVSPSCYPSRGSLRG